MRPFLLPALPLLLASLAGAAAAQPRCAPGREGEVACFAGKLCECRHEPGGALAGRPAGTRWDCGALRPACGGLAPADIAPPPAAAERAPPPFYLPPGPPPGAWR